VEQAKALFVHQGPARWNLVISHRKRVQINREMNTAKAARDAVCLEVSGKPARGNGAQTMLL
jgi:hypothetical protein